MPSAIKATLPARMPATISMMPSGKTTKKAFCAIEPPFFKSLDNTASTWKSAFKKLTYFSLKRFFKSSVKKLRFQKNMRLSALFDSFLVCGAKIGGSSSDFYGFNFSTALGAFFAFGSVWQ